MKKIFILACRLLVLASIAVSGLFAQGVPELIYYKFDVAGTTVQNQASAPVGTNPAPILGQTIGGTGQFGTALVGNGLTSTSNYVNTGWNAVISGPWTISMWVSNISTPSTTYYYFGTTSSSFRCFIGGVAPAGGILLRGTGVTDVPVTGIIPGPSVIHFVYNGTDIKAYVNGSLVNTVAQGTINISGTNVFKVGGYSSSNSIIAGSYLDEFRMYNRALDASEIGLTWNQQLPLNAATGTLEGYVYKYGTTDPIAGAHVAISTFSGTTSSTGFYSIPNIYVGTYTANCTATGYFSESVPGVQILENQTTPLDFYLKWAEIAINPTNFNVTLAPNAMTDQYLTLTNSGTGNLTYTSTIDFISEQAGIDLSQLGQTIPRDVFSDEADMSPEVQAVTLSTDATGDIVVDIDVQTACGDNQLLAAFFDGTNYWITGGGNAVNPNKIYKLSQAGALLATYDQTSTSAWGLRDLAYDGTYLYAGDENAFYRIDPATGASTQMFAGNLGLTCIRGCDYNPGNGNFYACNWATGIVEFTSAGAIITTHTAPAGLVGMYGLAYDEGTGKLWIFDQSGTPQQKLYQYDLTTNALTGVSYQVPFLTGETAGLAGGAFYSTTMVPGKAVVGGISQGTPLDRLFAMELYVTETWLTITANGSGTIPGTTEPSLDMTLHFDATGYAAGTVKTANIIINSNAGNNPVVSVPVTMIVSSGIQLDLKLFLEGPYNAALDQMSTFINGILPLNQPFNPMLPYYGNNNPCWLYNGTESVAAIPNANVVDWVMVEIRDGGTTGAFTVARQALFLLNDGHIAALDGSSLPQFQLTLAGDLYAVVYHRNHLGVMNSTAIPNSGGNLYVWDFTTGAGQYFGGSNGAEELETGVWGARSADGDANRQVNNDDKIIVWRPESGGAGYLGGDFNLDMQVNNADKIDYWAPNAGASSQVPN